MLQRPTLLQVRRLLHNFNLSLLIALAQFFMIEFLIDEILIFSFLQEQPLLLEELLEQEKQEQARNIGTNQMDIVGNVQNQQSLFSDQVCETNFFRKFQIDIKSLRIMKN